MGWLITVIWNHMPGMWRQMHGEKLQLNQEEMAHILAFLYQAGSADKPGDPAAGQKVFDAKGCVRCHAVRSNGATAAPDLAKTAAAGDRLAWMHAMWNHAQSMIEPVTKELGAWPQFNGVEMNDLVAYVNGAPSAAIQEDGCAARQCGSRLGSLPGEVHPMPFGPRKRRQDRSRTGSRARTAAHLRAVRRGAVESRSRDAAACA